MKLTLSQYLLIAAAMILTAGFLLLPEKEEKNLYLQFFNECVIYEYEKGVNDRAFVETYCSAKAFEKYNEEKERE